MFLLAHGYGWLVVVVIGVNDFGCSKKCDGAIDDNNSAMRFEDEEDRHGQKILLVAPVILLCGGEGRCTYGRTT
jgi:hypothetical protein